MPEYYIANIPVNFPFEPYDVQKAFMEKVIHALNERANAVLESPTGTGKTLSLLCSSLAWIVNRKTQMRVQELVNGKIESTNTSTPDQLNHPNHAAVVSKIIYASRTHSQLSQAMKELKRTSYNFMRAVVLGSRDQLCIQPDVMKETNNSNKIHLCKIRVQTKTCSFHGRVESKKDHPDFHGQNIMDVEDLVTIGRKLKMCPYYGSKELVKDADIIFMPYNYLLDPKARKANKVELNDTIIILDEAHNVEKLCEESASVRISSSDVGLAISELKSIIVMLQNEDGGENDDEPKDFTLDDILLLAEMLNALEKAIDEIVVDNIVDGTTYPAADIFELLEKANISSNNFNMVTTLLEKLIQFLAANSQSSHLKKGGFFQILVDFLSIVFVNKQEDCSKIYRSFKMHVQIEEIHSKYTGNANKGSGWLTTKANENATKKQGKVINYWCFNPGFGMEQLLNKNVRSIILTSGTLAPLIPLIAELSIPISYRLENPHIVSKSQVLVKIISAGPDREQLVSNYQNRDNPKYINSLGRTILALCPIIPDGVLVFFPSYPVMNKCIDNWRASGIWSQINRSKLVIVEPKNKESFTTAMAEYYEKIDDPTAKGACFMAVCRGKVSEGLDFADKNGRAVIITGLPFPPLKDPRVNLKKRYLDENRTKENELLTGNAWYALEATRAVNQAIGRVIRHKNDYGAILLCDARFNQPNQISQLSSWIREHLRTSQQQQFNFGQIIGEMAKFFKNAVKTMPKPSEYSFEQPSIIKSFDNTDDHANTNPFIAKKAENKIEKIPQRTLQKARSIENANSFSSWSPEEYALASGRSRTDKMPTAMDFMTRLDSDVSVIDFNQTDEKIDKSLLEFPEMQKREGTLSNTTPQSLGQSRSYSNELTKRKRYKLTLDNSPVFAGPSCSSFSASQPLTKYSFDKSNYSNEKNEELQAPENRSEFQKLIKRSLNPEKYQLFLKALMSYKDNGDINDLMAILISVFDHPCLHYLLRAMRRFIKERHKEIFDKIIREKL